VGNVPIGLVGSSRAGNVNLLKGERIMGYIDAVVNARRATEVATTHVKEMKMEKDANKRWFRELFAYTVVGNDDVRRSSSVVMRDVMAGNGDKFIVDCHLLVNRFDKMKLILNALKADNHGILQAHTDAWFDNFKLKGNKFYYGGEFMVAGNTSRIKIKVVQYDRQCLQIYVILNNAVSNFARFVYENKKFYWLLDVDWFRNWCDTETAKIVAEGTHPLLLAEIADMKANVDGAVKKKLASDSIPDVFGVDIINSVHQELKSKIEIMDNNDTQALITAVAAGGRKTWYWVFKNRGTAAEPVWKNIGGAPTVDYQTACSMADVKAGFVFATAKKSMKDAEVVKCQPVYEGCPF
jgi:hypothetical protein